MGGSVGEVELIQRIALAHDELSEPSYFTNSSCKAPIPDRKCRGGCIFSKNLDPLKASVSKHTMVRCATYARRMLNKSMMSGREQADPPNRPDAELTHQRGYERRQRPGLWGGFGRVVPDKESGSCSLCSQRTADDFQRGGERSRRSPPGSQWVCRGSVPLLVGLLLLSCAVPSGGQYTCIGGAFDTTIGGGTVNHQESWGQGNHKGKTAPCPIDKTYTAYEDFLLGDGCRGKPLHGGNAGFGCGNPTATFPAPFILDSTPQTPCARNPQPQPHVPDFQ